MKKLYISTMVFYLLAILSILPQQFNYIEIEGIRLDFVNFILSILGIVLLVINFSFNTPFLTDKKWLSIKKYVYINVTFNGIVILSVILFGGYMYELVGNFYIFYGIVIVSILATMYSFFKIHNFAETNQLLYSDAVVTLLDVGQEAETTDVYKAVSWLDRYFFLFIILTIILPNVYLLSISTLLLVLLAYKHLALVCEWIKVNLQSKKKSNLTMIMYFLSYSAALYLYSIGDNTFITVLIAYCSMFLVKTYYNKGLVR